MRILSPTPAAIDEAAHALRGGGLVVFPTETVYGLGADAMNPRAVGRIFEAKGRPADNPLIVHVERVAQGLALASSVPEDAARLAERFWPGPLTLVLPKRPEVPDETTGGLATVAVRMPAHPTARALVRASRTPIAAPSANLFMRLSPTRVEHLDPALLEHVAVVLDDGPAEVGIESTVVDFSEGRARLLRPGGVSRERLAMVLGYEPEDYAGAQRLSPGRYERHYSPRVPVRVVRHPLVHGAGLTFGRPEHPDQIQMPREAEAYATMLYDALARLDRADIAVIEVEAPPETLAWEAVWDRLRRAASPM